jgi:hypothetical protein
MELPCDRIELAHDTIRHAKRSGFDPGELVEAVRTYNAAAIQGAMRYVLGENRAALAPWRPGSAAPIARSHGEQVEPIAATRRAGAVPADHVGRRARAPVPARADVVRRSAGRRGHLGAPARRPRV